MGVGAVAVILLAVLTLLRALRNYSRLRAIPGPSAAGWSDIWRIYVRNKSHYGRRLSGLHREYGTVVRLGPRFLSVADGSIIGHLDQGVDEGVRVQACIRASFANSRSHQNPNIEIHYHRIALPSARTIFRRRILPGNALRVYRNTKE